MMRRSPVLPVVLALLALVVVAPSFAQETSGLVLEGKSGPGLGKHIVIVTGDEEYRSEEGMTQLAQILSERHGFKCTVLYAMNEGKVDAMRIDNIPGLEALAKADLMILFTRWRDLPDAQMKPIIDYIESGKPVIGLRTSTHAFKLNPKSAFAKYTYNSKVPGFEGGFGRQVLGETWVNHHGAHGKQATRGIVVAKDHPVITGIKEGSIYGPSDVYTVAIPLPGDSTPLVLGQVLEGMSPTDPPLEGPKNDPMMPIAWVKTYKGESGKTCRVFTTTMGASQDLLSPGLRRLIVNACYWTTGLEDLIFGLSNVDLVGDYKPTAFGPDKFPKGKYPSEFLSK